MVITKKIAAQKIAAYLHHDLSLEQLVDWAENVLLDGEVEEKDAAVIASVVARLGVADVRAFGLTWENCESLLHELGFFTRVDVVAEHA